MASNNAVCTFDFTLAETFTDGKIMTSDEIKGWLDKVAKKWCFQLETGKDGYRHFQGRLSLKVKKRLGTFVDEKPWPALHLSITSNANRDNDFYVMKDEGRLEGPWSDKDETPPYIPRQVRDIKKWRLWQEKVIGLLKIWDTRGIHCIVDPTGESGKSVLISALGASKIGTQIPFCNDYKDVLRGVMDRPKLGVYLIDMPRAINKEKLNQLYSAIETIKSGYAYDDRYHFKEEYFDCPNIFVFTNKMPDLELLSKDRWKIWTIDRSNWDLVPFTGNSGGAHEVPAVDIVRVAGTVPIVPSPPYTSGIQRVIAKPIVITKPSLDNSLGLVNNS